MAIEKYTSQQEFRKISNENKSLRETWEFAFRIPEGFAAIQKHRDAGHELVGITATSDFITAPIFREFGISEIIATNAEVVEGKYTGKVINTPCYQKGKLTRLDQWLAGRDVSESWAYSDSINDRFLLEYADHAIAVNPDDRLEALAKEQAWEIQDWSI